MYKKVFPVLGVLVFLLALVGPVYADDSDIVISEVMYNSACEAATTTDVCGSGSSFEVQFEWVEIFNKGATTVDLTGWQICDPGACDPLPGSSMIGPGEYWLISQNNDAPEFDLEDELNNYGSTVNAARTIHTGAAAGGLGANGFQTGEDAVYLRTDQSTCGAGSNLPCVSDCLSWHSVQTCAALVDGAIRAYLPGSDGYEGDTLLEGALDGQSIVNILGVWYESGPGTDVPNQASPYGVNTAESGSPTAISLEDIKVVPTSGLNGVFGVVFAVVSLSFILAWKRTHRKISG